MSWGGDLSNWEKTALSHTGMTPAAMTPVPKHVLIGKTALGKTTVMAGLPKPSGTVIKTASISSPTVSGDKVLNDLLTICPGIADVSRGCPACSQPECSLTSIIPHLNDNHRWPREKIADWLDIINMDPDIDLTVKLKEDDNGRADS